MSVEIENLIKVRKDIIKSVIELAEEHEYDFPDRNVPMLLFKRTLMTQFIGVNKEHGLIDYNENYHSLESFSTDGIAEALELCYDPVLPKSLDEYTVGNTYPFTMIEFSMERGDDEVSFEVFGEPDLINNGGAYLLSANEQMVCFVYISYSEKQGAIYRCVFNSHHEK